MKLSPYQKKCLGVRKQSELEQHIWNQELAKIYRQIDESNHELGDQGQTYPQFLKMEKRPPNQEGTGRHKFSYIRQIQLFFIPQKGSPQPKQAVKQVLCYFLSKYLRIPCVLDTQTQMEVSNKSLIDKKNLLVFSINTINNMMDAHQLQSVLEESQKQKTLRIAFIEHFIHNFGSDIDGLASGNGVAVLYYSRKDLSSKLEHYLLTLVHETLHTLGFDHCMAWTCMMNGYTNNQSWLCPACSCKIYHELQLTTPAEVVQWMKDIIKVCEKAKAKKTVKKGYQLVEAIEKVDC